MRDKIKGYLDYFLFRLGFKRKQGWTTFEPVPITPEYTNVDLHKKQVTGVVKYDGKVYLTVFVDVGNDKIEAKGSLHEIRKVTKSFTKENYIELIKNEASVLIENGIEEPKRD
ncbi:hypothetical protein [Alkalihalobacillus sp. LMS39]|uniref:hypothetical protein n=1 Tax=Alkalihalobacillus sp. LMS39 TaxID=2924032 RepID=UPI001FB53972|nr:hypothetical protein [Alkalihalobacillus sp. LMS39]UOE95197.1 hypothetical protein MM271_06120 [Alkalihalobacillus sp. LMS39]